MFLDIAPSEFLLTAIVAVIFIGPKDMPRALRTAGRWMGRMRRVSGHFRAGIETMIREAELEEMEAQWRAQNEAIMQAHPPAAGEAQHGGPQHGGEMAHGLAVHPEPVAAPAPEPGAQ